MAPKNTYPVQPRWGGRKPREGSRHVPIVEARTVFVASFGTITFELRHVLCGKKGCARLHGPYWYAEQRVGKKVRWVYIGKVLDAAKAEARLRAKR
jgi:hypothetical protein